jgi:hypothetical protein
VSLSVSLPGGSLYFCNYDKKEKKRIKKAQERSESKEKKWPRKKVRVREKKSVIRKRLKGKNK